MGSNVILGSGTCPAPRGRTQRSLPQRDLLNARTQDERQATKFYMVIALDPGKFLHGRPQMLTRDLFAVANRLVN